MTSIVYYLFIIYDFPSGKLTANYAVFCKNPVKHQCSVALSGLYFEDPSLIRFVIVLKVDSTHILHSDSSFIV